MCTHAHTCIHTHSTLAHTLTHVQDKAVKERIDARNKLETYLYNMKSTVEDKMKDKVGCMLFFVFVVALWVCSCRQVWIVGS